MNCRIKVETKDEMIRIKQLQEEIELLKLLLKKESRAILLDSCLGLAAKELGYKSKYVI